MTERVWEVAYYSDGRGHKAYRPGCVCGSDSEWFPHYHVGGIVHRAPDRLVRKRCDPLYIESGDGREEAKNG